jgi:hypothetical protein
MQDFTGMNGGGQWGPPHFYILFNKAASQTADMKRFDLEIFFDPELRSLASEA